MKPLFASFSMALIIIFGGAFLIHFVKTSEFLIAEFIGMLIGIALFLFLYFKQKRSS